MVPTVILVLEGVCGSYSNLFIIESTCVLAVILVLEGLRGTYSNLFVIGSTWYQQ